MDLATKLLPCHNCGSTNVGLGSKTVFDFIKCFDCGFEGPLAWDMVTLAVRAWNLQDIFGETGPRAERRAEMQKEEVQRLVDKFRADKAKNAS